MTNSTLISFGLICLVLLPLISHAKVDYISLHEIESAERQPLSVKLNIVEKNLEDQKSQLKFTLVNQNVETALSYKRINDYMLRLKSPHYIIGNASILVYELEQDTWQQNHSVNVSNSLIVSEIDKAALAKSTGLKAQCRLIREPKETLWSIASRYKEKWNIDIFSAMLAIYKTNRNKFAKQHIGQHINNAEQFCPSSETKKKMGEKAAMKAEFNRLHQRELNKVSSQ
jgi:hypothetical protein